jgi:hypothetical protein
MSEELHVKKKQLSRNLCIFATRNNKTTSIMEARLGDNVLISPEVTHKSEWTQGTVIDVEANPFVGMVISAKTADGEIYFEKANLFKPVM